MSVPFRSGQNAMGVLIIYARAPNAFGPRELELFFNLGRELGLAVSMSEARERMAALELARHAAEQAALSAQLDLVRAGRILSVAEVTTSIAHEVNQPITAILANAESALNWIDRSPPDLGPARAAIKRVVRDAERAGETVNRVRRLISKEAPQPSPCSLNAIVEATLAVMEPEVRSGAVELDLRLASPSPQVEVDKVQIEQVLVNLITNSLDAMRKGRQDGGARRMVVRTGLADADTALVAIEDNGDGFDSAIREKMFEHFFTTKNGGVGLGLALCAAIVQSHGGRIWATPASRAAPSSSSPCRWLQRAEPGGIRLSRTDACPDLNRGPGQAGPGRRACPAERRRRWRARRRRRHSRWRTPPSAPVAAPAPNGPARARACPAGRCR